MSDDRKNWPPLPGAHYGEIDESYDPATDTSPLPEPDHMDDDNDEYHPTDQSLIDMLGFDPEEWENEEAEAETVKNQDGSFSKRKK